MKEPTPRQRQIFEAVERLGSLSAAGRELGISVGAISSGMSGYRQKTGVAAPVASSRVNAAATLRQRRARLEELPARLDQVEAALLQVAEILKTTNGQLVESHNALAEAINGFLARQPIVLAPARDAVVPTHRRQADGGIGGRAEVRQGGRW